MKAHVRFLADDSLRGREAGSAEYRIAADYVAARFYAAGLDPAGDANGSAASYIRKVPLVTYSAADTGDGVPTRACNAPVPLVFGEDYSPGTVASAARTVIDAGVVFVGYGLARPRWNKGDFVGLLYHGYGAK